MTNEELKAYYRANIEDCKRWLEKGGLNEMQIFTVKNQMRGCEQALNELEQEEQEA